MINELENTIINWLYAVETKDSFLLADSNYWMCELLDNSKLKLLFEILKDQLNDEELDWVYENLSAQ